MTTSSSLKTREIAKWIAAIGAITFLLASSLTSWSRRRSIIDSTDSSANRQRQLRLEVFNDPKNVELRPIVNAYAQTDDCTHMLDALDHQFDQRRKARQDFVHHGNNYVKQFDDFEPEATCFSQERFGSASVERYSAFGDGPKFVCGVDVIAAKAKSEGCLVYSIGSNNDIRFEKAAYTHMNGCEIHTFDPTLNKPFVGGDYATFHPWGVGIDGEKMRFRKHSWTAMSFEHIIKELGHENQVIDVLKIDCEGCEYSTMPPLFEMIAAGRIRVNQVQIELHTAEKSEIDHFFKSADSAGLRIFQKERNHWGCAGYKCVEYSLISESFLRESNAATVCPQ